jgi:hypothetical protein
MVYARTAHNRSVYASPPTAARAPKNRSRDTHFVRFFSATIWPAAMLRIDLWAGQNVVNSRNVMCNCAKRIKKYTYKNVLKNILQ